MAPCKIERVNIMKKSYFTDSKRIVDLVSKTGIGNEINNPDMFNLFVYFYCYVRRCNGHVAKEYPIICIVR